MAYFSQIDRPEDLQHSRERHLFLFCAAAVSLVCPVRPPCLACLSEFEFVKHSNIAGVGVLSVNLDVKRLTSSTSFQRLPVINSLSGSFVAF